MRNDSDSESTHGRCQWCPRVALEFCTLLAVAFISGNCFADGDVYKIKRSDGRIEYTDEQPGASAAVKRLHPFPDTAGVVLVSPTQVQEIDNRIKARLAEQNRQYDAVTSAEDKLLVAQKAKAGGEEPLSGERQRLAGRGSRLNERYVQRQDQLDNDVKAAQAEVAAARGR